MSGEGTTMAERVTATAGRGRSRAALAAYWGLRAIGVPLVRLYFRFEVVHRDRIPPSGSYVICPVHRSNLDFMLPALAYYRRRDIVE